MSKPTSTSLKAFGKSFHVGHYLQGGYDHLTLGVAGDRVFEVGSDENTAEALTHAEAKARAKEEVRAAAELLVEPADVVAEKVYSHIQAALKIMRVYRIAVQDL